MFESLKNSKESRLAAAVAVGVFGGLLAYRMFMWTHAWWNDLSSAQIQELFPAAFAAIVAGLMACVIIWDRNKQAKKRRVHAEQVADLASITLVTFVVFAAINPSAPSLHWSIVVAGCLAAGWLILRVKMWRERRKNAKQITGYIRTKMQSDSAQRTYSAARAEGIDKKLALSMALLSAEPINLPADKLIEMALKAKSENKQPVAVEP